MAKEFKIFDFIKKNRQWLLLGILVLVQAVCITCMFGANKKDFHSDELWNYGFANSSECTHISRRNTEEPNTWQDSDRLFRYISVQKNEIFDYASAYRNAANDYNPFLGYYFLHFICSLFPDTWSMWYGFALNIICFVFTQIFLYKLIKCMTGHTAALAGCFFFGFTTGASSIASFLRIYAPAVLFTTMTAYYMTQIYCKRNEKVPVSLWVKLALTALAGCLTLNLYLLSAFMLTAMFCLYYICTKRFKRGIGLGLLMLSVVAVSFAVFPAVIEQVFLPKGSYSYTSRQMTPWWQFKAYMNFLMSDLFGVHVSVWKTMTLEYMGYGFLVLAFFFVPVCFVFRNEQWLHHFFYKMKNIAVSLLKKGKNFQFALAAIFADIVFVMAIAARRTSVISMQECSNRYIFIIYPLAAAFFTALAYYISSWIIRNVKVRTAVFYVLAILFIVMNHLNSYNSYYFNYPKEGVCLEQLEDNANCIVVLSANWLMTCLTCKMGHTSHYFETNYQDAMKETYHLESMAHEGPLYLVLDISGIGDGERVFMGIDNGEVNIVDDFKNQNKKEDYMEYFSKLDGVNALTLVGSDYAFGRKLEIYRMD